MKTYYLDVFPGCQKISWKHPKMIVTLCSVDWEIVFTFTLWCILHPELMRGMFIQRLRCCSNHSTFGRMVVNIGEKYLGKDGCQTQLQLSISDKLQLINETWTSQTAKEKAIKQSWHFEVSTFDDLRGVSVVCHSPRSPTSSKWWFTKQNMF